VGIEFYFIFVQLPLRSCQRRLVLYLALAATGGAGLVGGITIVCPADSGILGTNQRYPSRGDIPTDKGIRQLFVHRDGIGADGIFTADLF
jgi:hypothetical protein